MTQVKCSGAGFAVVLFALLVALCASAAETEPAKLQALYDTNWRLSFYLKDNVIYSTDWQIQYYVRDDSVFDKRWIKRYYLKDDALYDWDWHRRYYIKDYALPEKK